MAEAKIGLLELVEMGYAVFAPIRRGHNGNPGPFWETLVSEPWGSEAMGPQLVAALAGECDDPRFEAQIVYTAKQFSTVKDVAVTINGTPMQDLLGGLK